MSKIHGPSLSLSGLISYLDASNVKSYPGTGSLWVDITGTGNHATLVNNPTYNGTNVGSITFNGSSQYAVIQNATGLTPNQELSITIWFNPAALSGYLLDKNGVYSQVVTTNGLQFAFVNQGQNVILDTLKWLYLTIYEFIAPTSWTASGAMPLSVGSWFSSTLVFSGGNQYLYNGANLAYSVSNSFSAVSNTNALILGTSLSANNAYFNGSISSVMIYNRALTATEVAYNYYAVRNRYGVS